MRFWTESGPISTGLEVDRPSLEEDGRPRVVVVDDGSGASRAIASALADHGHEVTVGDPSLPSYGDVMIVDVASGSEDGALRLEQLKQKSPHSEFIVTAPEVASPAALAFIRAGAFDVVSWPNGAEELAASVARALLRQGRGRKLIALARDSQRLSAKGVSASLPKAALDLAREVTNTDVASLVLVDGAGRPYVAYAHGLPEGYLLTPCLQPPSGGILELREPVLVVRDALPGLEEDPHARCRVRSFILVPLFSDGQFLGTLNVGRTDAASPLTACDVERLSIIANNLVRTLETMTHAQRVGLTERLHATGQVASSVMHEINNPLATVVGQHYMALNTIDELTAGLDKPEGLSVPEMDRLLADVRQCLLDAQSAAAALRTVAANIGVASSRDGGHRRAVEARELVQGALRLASGEVRLKSEITTEVPAGLSVFGDAPELCQLLLLLVLDASRAQREAAVVDPVIRISAMRVAHEIRIDVTANRPLLGANEIMRIFEPFSSPEIAGSSAQTLGIAMSRDLVRRNGGRIEVHSDHGVGTTFSVFLSAALPSGG
jgi:two-component system, NtrC family, sensor kinase